MGQKVEVGGCIGELHEAGGFSELEFEGLQSGDMIMLETATGSSYMLTVEADYRQETLKASVERNNPRQEVSVDQETSWESVESGTLFDLRGSCQRALTDMDNHLAAIDVSEGHFAVGQRAWLTTEIEGKERTLITSPIERIGLIPAA